MAVAVAWAILSGRAMYNDGADAGDTNSNLPLLPSGSTSKRTRGRKSKFCK